MEANNLLVGITIDEYKGIKPSLLLKIIRKIGLNFVEITKSFFDDLPDALNEIGKVKTGFHLPNCGDFGYDFSSIDYSDEIDKLIALINEHRHNLNIQYCLTHPPECSSVMSDNDTRNSFLFENLKKIKAPIIIENVVSLNQKQFAEFYSLAKAALGRQLIGQCYDAPHYFVRGEDPLLVLDSFDGTIKSVHLSDCKKDKDAHLPFGLGGELPIDEILYTLKRKNYSGIINLELLPRSLSDLEALINSYLKVLKIFDKKRYFYIKFKLLLYMPILRQNIMSS